MSGIFSEGSKISMTRVLSLLVVLTAMVVGVILALTGKLDGNGVAMVLGLVGVAFTGKAVQKAMEQK